MVTNEAKTSIDTAIAALIDAVRDPSSGLPQNLFHYVSRTTPLVNVDLLIKDEKGRTLLSWRNDRYAGTGWHIPGGILRFKEKLQTRVEKVAETEIGAAVRFNPTPIAFNQVIDPEHNIRGHFLSFLYQCFLESSFAPANNGLTPKDAGYLAWHETCPQDLIKVHEIYRQFIEAADYANG